VDILDDMGVSKLSAKVFYSFKYRCGLFPEERLSAREELLANTLLLVKYAMTDHYQHSTE